MRHWIGFGLALSALAAHGPRPQEDEARTPELGEPAPELAFAAVLNEAQPLERAWSARRGEVVVLEFWATWCGPCIPALAHLEELAADFAGKPVRVLGISPEEPERMQRFLDGRPLAFPVALDRDGATFAAFGVQGVPTTIVVDAQGRIAARTRPAELTAEVLERVLAGQPAGLAARVDVAADIEWAPELGAEGEVYASVVIAESKATRGGTRFQPGSGRMSGDGVHLLNLIQLAWDVPNTRLTTDLPPWSESDPVYKVAVLAPGGDDALARLMLQGALRAKFALRERWSEEERDVHLLRRRADAAPWAESNAPQGERTQSAFGGGVSMVGAPLEFLRSWCENIVQTPVLDETGLAGHYDLELSWVDSKSFQAELTRVGLELARARKPVRVLRVETR